MTPKPPIAVPAVPPVPELPELATWADISKLIGPLPRKKQTRP